MNPTLNVEKIARPYAVIKIKEENDSKFAKLNHIYKHV
jgi:hypothetical protein